MADLKKKATKKKAPAKKAVSKKTTKAESKKSNDNAVKKEKKSAGRPPRGQETTIEEVKSALQSTMGHQGLAAEKLGISGASLTDRIKNNPELQEFRDNLRPKLFMWGMSKLQQHVDSGNLDALKFMMKGIGHDINFYPNTNKSELEISQKEGTTWRIERVVVKKD